MHLTIAEIMQRYEKLKRDIASGIDYKLVDAIEGQNWLDINEARIKGAK